MSVGACVPTALAKQLIRRAQHTAESLSAVVRKDLELVEAWRQRKRDSSE